MNTTWYYAKITDVLGNSWKTQLYSNVLNLKKYLDDNDGWFTSQLGHEFYINPDCLVSIELFSKGDCNE